MGAQPASESYEFRDHGRTVKVQLPVHARASDLDIRSTGDSLTIVDNSAFRTLLKVVQLYSTVDATATDWRVADGTLTVTLTKLEPAIQWAALDTQAAALREQAVSEAQTSRALQERDRVKALLTAAQSGSLPDVQAAAGHFAGQQLGEIKDASAKNALHFSAQLGHTQVCHYLLTEQQVDVNLQDEAGQSCRWLASLPLHSSCLPHDSHPHCPRTSAGCMQLSSCLCVSSPSPYCTGIIHCIPVTPAAVLAQYLTRAESPCISSLIDGSVLQAAFSALWLTTHLSSCSCCMEGLSSGLLTLLLMLLHGHDCPAKCPLHQGFLLPVAGETALTLAAGSGEPQTVELLLQHAADIDRCRPGGAQPIHTAAASGAAPSDMTS